MSHTLSFAAAAAALCAAAAAQSSFVVPAANAGKLGDSVGGLPFSYTRYVRYQQAIGTKHFPRAALLFGMSFRPRTRALALPEVQKQSMIVKLSDSKNPVGSLSGTYGTNVGTNVATVFRGTFDVRRTNRFDALEFSTHVPFAQPYLHTNRKPLLIDMQPTGFRNWRCGRGGNGTGFDFVRKDPNIASVLGKNKSGCGTPTSGGFSQPGGFVIRFMVQNVLAPYGKGCVAAAAKPPAIASRGGQASTGNGSFAVTLSGVPSGVTSALFVLGASATSYLGQPLPLSLGIVGAPDCWLDASAAATASAAVAAGVATAPLPVPNDPSLRGRSVFADWLWIAGGRVASSQGGRITVR